MKLSRLIVLSLAASQIFGACASRNLYRNTRLGPPPVERGYVYVTREDASMHTGADPVEFGSPVSTTDSVFVASESRGLEAFERRNFQRKWQFKVKNGVSGAVAYASTSTGGVVYFGANDGVFYALDAEFGKILWKYETKAPVYARATLANKRIYVSASDDVVYCLDQVSGKWIWHYKRGGSYITTVHGNSSAAVEAGLTYVGFSDGYLVALNAQDGNLVWEQKIHKGSKFTDVDAMPLVDGDQIYVPSYDGELYALDRQKGRVLWHIDVGGSKKALVDDRTLYLGATNGNVYAITKESGRILWKFELDVGSPTNLVQKENYLAFGSSQQYFYVIHKGDGSLAYRYNVGMRSGFVSTPAQAGDDIYLLSNFGNLYQFRWTKIQNKKVAAAKLQ